MRASAKKRQSTLYRLYIKKELISKALSHTFCQILPVNTLYVVFAFFRQILVLERLKLTICDRILSRKEKHNIISILFNAEYISEKLIILLHFRKVNSIFYGFFDTDAPL